MALEDAQLLLKKKKLDFQEHSYDVEQSVELPWTHVKVTAMPGDRLLQTRTPVYAHTACACEYDLFLTLLFGPEKRLKQGYVDSQPICL